MRTWYRNKPTESLSGKAEGRFWSAGIDVWRIQAGFRLMRHVYPDGGSDRWVLQPNFVYDCKEKT